jgi:hypothetical protein
VIVVFGSFSFFISGLDLFFFFLGYWNLFDNLGFGTLFLLEKEIEGVIELDFLGFFPIFFSISSHALFKTSSHYCRRL